MSDTIVPALAILVLFGGPILYLIVNRSLNYIERIEMIKHGMVPPQTMKGRPMPPPWENAGPVPPASAANSYGDYQASGQLRNGIRVGMIGLAITIGLSFLGFGPWLIGGLVPLFVGIAQIIIAVLAGAEFPARRRPPFEFGPPPPGPPPPNYGSASAPNNPSSGPPYGWRPGPTTELQGGPKPPDVRG